MDVDHGSVEPVLADGKGLRGDMAGRTQHDAQRQRVDAHYRRQRHRANDDGNVVDVGRQGRHSEYACSVEAGGHNRGDGEEDRRQQHPPREFDFEREAARVLDGCDCGNDRRSREPDHDRQRHENDENQIGDGRHDPPGPPVLTVRQQRRRYRNEGRSDRARGYQLEQSVGNTEGRQERVKLAHLGLAPEFGKEH